MRNLIAKADVLIEALPYIQRLQDAIIVVKVGGSAMEDQRQVDNIMLDVAFMACVGMRPVIIHGGGKAISRAMQKAGLAPKFVKGLRVTDEAAIGIVDRVLRDEINANLVATLVRLGAPARRVDGPSVFQVIRRAGRDETTGADLDWGYVGEVTGVDAAPVRDCLAAHGVPVLTPLGRGPDGHIYNLNADDAAAAIARALGAWKLAYLSDVPGLLRNRADEASLMSTLHIKEVEELIRQGVIEGGMLPKIRSCVEALEAGVKKIHVIDGRLSHSLLLEIFTDKGVGTEIIA